MRIDDRDDRRQVRIKDRADDWDFKAERRAARRFDREIRKIRFDNQHDDRRFRYDNETRRFAGDDGWRRLRGRSGDCLPGLARKNNGDLPPGRQIKWSARCYRRRLERSSTMTLRQWYRDDEAYLYRNDGHYIYRVNRGCGLIDALFPFQVRDFNYYGVGQQLPSNYGVYNVPMANRDRYYDARSALSLQ